MSARPLFRSKRRAVSTTLFTRSKRAGLRHFIESAVVPVVRLNEVLRQAAQSRIIKNAHRINEGQMPSVPTNGQESDFFFPERTEPDDITATLVDMVRTRMPRKFGLDAFLDVQVLCPMNRGSLGIRELNVRLQQELNPPRPNEPPMALAKNMWEPDEPSFWQKAPTGRQGGNGGCESSPGVVRPFQNSTCATVSWAAA